VFDVTKIVIDIHGGGFMLGHSNMVNKDQVQDCLDRGWIVVVPNHRLSPQVDIFEGPVQDTRDLLAWIHDGKLDDVIAKESSSAVRSDLEKVVAFGTSAGGTLALSLVSISAFVGEGVAVVNHVFTGFRSP
jgi:acetyl esterase/lipase